MTGGSGNDTYFVDSASDSVTELLSEGTDTVQSTVNFTLVDNLENLTLTGSSNLGNGNELNNTIVGSNAASTLDGKAGTDRITGGSANDTLIGGLGDDTLDGGIGSDWVDYSAATNDMVVDLKSSGTSTVSLFISAVDQGTDTLSNIENIKTGSGKDIISATGTTGASAIANMIWAGGGDDTVNGGDGANALYGEAGNDKLTGGIGNDTIFGGAGNDSITGVGGSDSLVAGDGVDTLTGGAGFDTFNLFTDNTSITGDRAIGGGGGDTFIINAAHMNSIDSGTLIEGSVGSVDTLRIIGTSGARIDFTASSLINANFHSINTIDMSTDNFSSTIIFNSKAIQNLVDLTGEKNILTLKLNGNDIVEIEPEANVFVNDYRSSASFYSDAAKTQLIAQVIYA